MDCGYQTPESRQFGMGTERTLAHLQRAFHRKFLSFFHFILVNTICHR